MPQYEEYTFDVVAVHDGTQLPRYQSGLMSATRRFKVPARYAEEFAFRMLGRYYQAGVYESPELPVEYPWDDNPGDFREPSTIRMVAQGFSIDPVSAACFTSIHYIGETENTENFIRDPSKLAEMERYYAIEEIEDRMPSDYACCETIVTIQYASPKWTCKASDLTGVLANTAIRVRRKSGYEMFTLPNRSLVWHALPDSVDSTLKGDANAAIIIPKSDITIEWYNIPVTMMCALASHLDSFRGTVNQSAFGDSIDCESDIVETGSDPVSCSTMEAETLLFIDWEEIDEERTNTFRFMDTTAIRIHIKQRRIVDPVDDAVKGWNHFFFDRTRGDTPTNRWERVKVLNSGGKEDLFPLKSWANLLDHTL